MDKIISYIEQNPVIAVTGAAILVFLAGYIVRKFKAVSVVLILIAAFGFFTLLKANKVGKAKIDEINKAGKIKVDEIKNEVKTKIIKSVNKK